jgi:uncharacterized protein
MIKVDLSTLVHARPGEREVVVVDLDEFSLDDLEFKFLKGELSFTRVADGILTEGVLHTAIRVKCTRCLTPFDQPVVIELEDIINFPGADRTPERPVRVTGDGWADLSPLIREYAWVNLPVSPVCSLDCQGICPRCGKNINLGECTCSEEEEIDPRWEALRELLLEEEQ